MRMRSFLIYFTSIMLMAAASISFIDGWNWVAHAALAPVTLAIIQADLRQYAIPVWLLVLAAILGCVFIYLDAYTLTANVGLAGEVLGQAVIEGAIVLAIAGCASIIYERIRGRAGIGRADIYFFAIVGIWLPLSSFGVFLFAAALGALAATILRQIRRRRPIQSATYVPFCAFQAATLWAMTLFVY
ncbi:MAG: prepilin peptidase [Pseudomonadota bacterium]